MVSENSLQSCIVGKFFGTWKNRGIQRPPTPKYIEHFLHHPKHI